MDRLVADNLNESDLDRYLKSSDQRSTYGLGIPEQSSINAPSAFDLGDKVKLIYGSSFTTEKPPYRNQAGTALWVLVMICSM